MGLTPSRGLDLNEGKMREETMAPWTYSSFSLSEVVQRSKGRLYFHSNWKVAES